MMKNFVILFFLLFPSCAYFTKITSKSSPRKTSQSQFILKDKAGEYLFSRESGRKNSQYVTKRKIFLNENTQDEKILEKSIAISSVHKINNVEFLAPDVSQFTVWFDSQKYFTQMKFDWKRKELEVSLESPEEQWSGLTIHPFPSDLKAVCFFSQIVECAQKLGFLDKSTSFKRGTMNLYLLMEGFPFVREIYLDLPTQIFLKAKFQYEGLTKEKERKYVLEFAGQSIFYFLKNNSDDLVKIFWISQGLSITKK